MLIPEYRNEDHAAVAVTSGILKILNKDELEGVVAHELSHIAHKDNQNVGGTPSSRWRIAAWFMLLSPNLCGFG